MAVKIGYFQNSKTSEQSIKCYKIIRKTVKFQHIMENDKSITDRFKDTYETILSSYDITDYVVNGNEWIIPDDHVIEEIRINKMFGIIPVSKTVSEGFIFTYTQKGIIEYINELQHCQTLYGKSHFNDDLHIYECEIPANTVYYEGTNCGKGAYASKALIFIKDITKEVL